MTRKLSIFIRKGDESEINSIKPVILVGIYHHRIALPLKPITAIILYW